MRSGWNKPTSLKASLPVYAVSVRYPSSEKQNERERHIFLSSSTTKIFFLTVSSIVYSYKNNLTTEDKEDTETKIKANLLIFCEFSGFSGFNYPLAAHQLPRLPARQPFHFQDVRCVLLSISTQSYAFLIEQLIPPTTPCSLQASYRLSSTLSLTMN